MKNQTKEKKSKTLPLSDGSDTAETALADLSNAAREQEEAAIVTAYLVKTKGKKESVDPVDPLDLTISKGTLKTTTTKPTISTEGETADKLYIIIKGIKDLEAEKEVVEGEIRVTTDQLYEHDQVTGNDQSSYRLPGAKTPGVMAVYTERFSKIPYEEQETLKKDKEFYSHFEETVEITIKVPTPETVRELIALIGLDKFNEYFVVERYYKPKNARVKYLVPESIKVLIKQAKPGFRLMTAKGKV